MFPLVYRTVPNNALTDPARDNMSDAALRHGIAAIEEYGLLMIEGKVQKAVAQDEELTKLVVDHMNSLSH